MKKGDKDEEGDEMDIIKESIKKQIEEGVESSYQLLKKKKKKLDK